MWAAGILAYELMLGGPPFEADTKAETYSRITSEAPFLPSMWSQDAADFLTQVCWTWHLVPMLVSFSQTGSPTLRMLHLKRHC